MKAQFSVSISRIIKEFSAEVLVMPGDADELKVCTTEVNRPGLQFAGYFGEFDEKRIQVVGSGEHSYLNSTCEIDIESNVETFFSKKPVLVVIARDNQVPQYFIDFAQKYQVPLLRTKEDTSSFMAALIAFLNLQLAPRITRHGVLVEVYGEGILLLGESGVGKSETAIELIKRGHRLIADDAVEIRRVSSKSLVGTSPENIRHFIELRGIGIVNAMRIFGVGAVKMTEKIDLVVNMELWDSSKTYDRMGLEKKYTNILGLDIPSVTIPIKPGRNLAMIIEVAAMNNRQQKLGYNSAEELLNRLGMGGGKENKVKEDPKPFE